MASLLVLLMAVAIKGVWGQSCDLDTSGPSMIWTSPNYPASYPADSSCMVNLTQAAAPIPRTLIFNDIALERKRARECRDYIGVNNPGEDHLHKICRPKYTKYIIPHTNAYLGFESSSKKHSRGFNVTIDEGTSSCYKLIDMEALNITSGYIMSPNFPRRFNKMDRCEWWIKSTSVTTIKLHVSTMKMRYSEGCRKSYVAVDVSGTHDYGYNSGINATKICGRETQTITGLVGKDLGVVFYAGRQRAKGFKAKFSRD